MSDHLQTALDELRMVTLMHRRVGYDAQDRELMRDRLENAKEHIDIHIDEMDRVDALRLWTAETTADE